ncbi:unnamed protein product [Dovyalis caffra]|uniref:Uncharacterized protein n=1 Tax=Dovyalis caffra TaxID=77055 RepID=A0AAV1RL30_9ROSI|nr:unnamed protein product [Dovyalis caffra]
MGNIIGHTIKIDFNTQTIQRGKSARIAIDMDLETLMKASIRVEDRDQQGSRFNILTINEDTTSRNQALNIATASRVMDAQSYRSQA